jgi:hypothetical protein
MKLVILYDCSMFICIWLRPVQVVGIVKINSVKIFTDFAFHGCSLLTLIQLIGL